MSVLDIFEEQVNTRSTKVAEIISRHLKAIHDEILEFDERTLNVEYAGDRAEIARQVLVELVDQLRGFATGSRAKFAEERAARRELGFDDDGEEDVRADAG
jgi:hypothetical protein